jgi:WD40 repeat protein
MTDFEQMQKDFISTFVAKTLVVNEDPESKDETTNVHFNHNGSLMAGCTEGGLVKLYDVEKDFTVMRSYKNISDPELKDELYMTRYVLFSPDNTYLVVCSKLRLVVLNLSDFSEVFVLSDVEMMPQGKDNIRMFCGVNFSPEGDYLAVGMNKRVDIFDTRNGFAQVATYDTLPKINNIVFHGDKLIFGAAYDGITLVDRASKNVLATYNFKTKEQDHLRYMDITPRGLLFLSLYACNPRTLNPDTLEVVQEFDIPYPVFFKHRHLNEDITVASGGIRGWQQFNHSTGKVIDKYENYEDGYHASMTDCFHRDLSPDNRYIAVCGEKEIRIIYTPMAGISKMSGKIAEDTDELVKTDPDFEDVQINDDVLYAMAATLV